MVSRKHRLVNAADFARVFARARRVRGQAMQLLALRTQEAVSRFAVVASLKVSKRAVVRNRLRRRIYEHVRRRMPEMSVSHDCVFQLRAQAVPMPQKAFIAEVDVLLEKAGLVTHSPKA